MQWKNQWDDLNVAFNLLTGNIQSSGSNMSKFIFHLKAAGIV